MAGRARRLIAFVLDAAIWGGLSLGLQALIAGIEISIAGGITIPDESASTIPFLPVDLLGAVIATGLTYAYVLLFWGLAGGTPGKLILGLRIVDPDGNTIGIGKSLLRLVGYHFSATLAFLGFIWIGVDRLHQGWHDRLALTYVIYKRRRISEREEAPEVAVDAAPKAPVAEGRSESNRAANRVTNAFALLVVGLVIAFASVVFAPEITTFLDSSIGLPDILSERTPSRATAGVDELLEAAAIIQDAVVQVLVVKSIGDEIMAEIDTADARLRTGAVLLSSVGFGKDRNREMSPSLVTDMKAIGDIAENQVRRLRNLASPTALHEYRATTMGWASNVSEAAREIASGAFPPQQAKTIWSAVPAEPRAVSVDLPNDVSVAALETGMDVISSAKTDGDHAVFNGDRRAMRVVGARLQAQNHWLRSQRTSDYAVDRQPCPRRGGCFPEVLRILPGVYRSAYGYAAEEPNAKQSWNHLSNEAVNRIEAGGLSLGGAGVGQDEPADAPTAVPTPTYTVVPTFTPRPTRPKGVERFDGVYEYTVTGTLTGYFEVEVERDSVTVVERTEINQTLPPTRGTFSVQNGVIEGDASGLIVDESGAAHIAIPIDAGGSSGSCETSMKFSDGIEGIIDVTGNLDCSFSGQQESGRFQFAFKGSVTGQATTH